jgi:hypothetical protein
MARVRARVRSERAQAAARRRRAWIAVAGTAGLAAALTIVAPALRLSAPPEVVRPPIAVTAPPAAARAVPDAPRSPARVVRVPRRRYDPRPGAGLPPATAVLVEAGQAQALARLANAAWETPVAPFTVRTLDAAAALPELQVTDLPRLAATPLEAVGPAWLTPEAETEDAVPESNEGSGL